MLSADLLRAARLRAGLSQRELATRSGRPQSSIARWESGAMRPSLETLQGLLRACGFELWYQLARADDSYVEFVDRALELPPAERLDEAVRAAAAVRELQPAFEARDR
jgi:transcriptional regulator with XRE-family HTH domain